MVLAAFVSVGFGVAGVHAFMLLKDTTNRFHQKALSIALVFGATGAVLQGMSGDLSARHVAQHQPVKLAALEGHWETGRSVPIRIGGIPNDDEETTSWSINIPYGLSLLAFHDPGAEVMGLKDVPKDERPNALITHLAFQTMVGIGSLLVLVGALGLFLRVRKKFPWEERRYLQLLAWCAPLGFVALEAGWTVTETGRQPWVIHGVMRTRDAVTTMPNLQVPFITFTLLYLFLSVVVFALMKLEVFQSPAAAEVKDARA